MRRGWFGEENHLQASRPGVQLKAAAVTQPSYFYFPWAVPSNGYHTTVIKANCCIQMHTQSYTVRAHRHTTETTVSSKTCLLLPHLVCVTVVSLFESLHQLLSFIPSTLILSFQRVELPNICLNHTNSVEQLLKNYLHLVDGIIWHRIWSSLNGSLTNICQHFSFVISYTALYLTII